MAKLAQAQIEQLSAIGAYLRQVRQEQGLAVDVVANQVFIRPALLRALEEGREDELPEPVFVQGFIRRYAEALGLDGQVLSQEFSVTPVDVLPDLEAIGNVETNGVVQPETRHSIKVLSKAEPSISSPVVNRSMMLWLLPGVLGLGLLIGLWQWFSSNRHQAASAPTDSIPEVQSQPTPPSPTPDSSTANSATTEATTPDSAASNSADTPSPAPTDAPKPEAPVVVSLKVTEPAWLEVRVDGKRVAYQTYEPGFSQTWTANQSILVRSGNAGGVEIGVNGDQAIAMGEAGVAKTIEATPDSDTKTLLGQ